MRLDWLVGLLTAAASIVSAIYVFQVIWPRIRSVFRSEEGDPAERTRRLLRVYRARTGVGAPSAPAPDIQFVRSAREGADLVVLLINRGGPALHLRIETPPGVEGTIEPIAVLGNERTGSLRLTATPDAVETPFVIVYEDADGVKRRRAGRCRVTGGRVLVEDDSR